jgi:hypothetical protein
VRNIETSEWQVIAWFRIRYGRKVCMKPSQGMKQQAIHMPFSAEGHKTVRYKNRRRSTGIDSVLAAQGRKEEVHFKGTQEE